MGAGSAEDPAHSGPKGQVQQGDDHHHDDHEHQHHERVVDQFLAGRCDDLLQFADDLADEECDAGEEAVPWAAFLAGRPLELLAAVSVT